MGTTTRFRIPALAFMVLGDLARGQQFPESPLPETSSGFRLGLGFWSGFWFAVYGIRVQPNLKPATQPSLQGPTQRLRIIRNKYPVDKQRF